MSELERGQARQTEAVVTEPAPCPFCREALASWFAGPESLDQAEQCPRCLAAVLFTTNPEDSAHHSRLAASLMAFLPDEDVALQMHLRLVRDVGWLKNPGLDRAIHLLAAWNLEELVSPSMAAAILRQPRDVLSDLLRSGELTGLEETQHSPYGGRRSSWLIPRASLLQYLNTLQDEG